MRDWENNPATLAALMVTRASESCYALSLLLFRKCQHVVTNCSHLPSILIKFKLFPSAEVTAAKDQKLFSPFFFPSRPGQTVPLHQAKKSGVSLGLAARSQEPGVRSPDSLPDLQMGSQSQTQSLPPGQAEGLLPSCELHRRPKKKSCIFELPVKGV